MQRADQRSLLAIAIVTAAVLFAIGFAWSMRPEQKETWKPAAEGFLAIARPCCTSASLWDALDAVTADKQRAHPASAAEAANWLNEWPYRGRDEPEIPDHQQPRPAVRNSEVRCVGEPSGPEIRSEGDDQETLRGIHFRRECTFAKWNVWAESSPGKRPNERHTVWVDKDGFFHGRVDYWR